MSELLLHLSKVLPALAVLAVVFAFIGWSLRGLTGKPQAAAKALPAVEKGRDERVKNLEASLEKERASRKALKAELDGLKSSTVIKENHDKVLAELEAAHQSLATESKRTAALETELKRAQETIKGHNARSNEAGKAQKERDFTLQNELSKAREQLSVLQNRPDSTAELEAEIDRLRDSVATTTRFAGELRKREAATTEELEKLRIQLAELSDGKPQKPAKSLGPVGDTDRVAAAKAEVLRLVEKNKRDQIARSAPAVTEETPLPVMPAPAVVAPETVAARPAFAQAVPSASPAAAPQSPAPMGGLKELPAESATKLESPALASAEAEAPGVEVVESPAAELPAAEIAATEPVAAADAAAPEIAAIPEPVKEPENPTA